MSIRLVSFSQCWQSTETDTRGVESCLQCLGSEKVKKDCFITFCNLTPMSVFWIDSHSLPSDAFGPGSIIIVQFNVESNGELTLLRKGTQFKDYLAEIRKHLLGIELKVMLRNHVSVSVSFSIRI